MDELMPLNTLANKTNSLICTISRDGYFTYLNPHWSDLLGWSLHEIMALPCIKYVHPEDRELTTHVYQQLFDGAKINDFRNRYLNDSGKYLWLQWFVTLLPDGGLAASAHEIDELVVLENQLNQHSLLFDQVNLLGDMGHWTINLEAKQVFWSKEVYVIHGVTPEQYKPELESAIKFYHPDDVSRIEQLVNNALTKGKGWNFTLRIVRPDGEIRTVRSLAEISRNSEGNPNYLLGMFQDVTDYEDLNKQVKLLSLVANTSNAGVVICDDERKVVWVNKAFTLLTGYELDDILGAGLGRLLQGPNTSEETIKQVKYDLEKGKNINLELLNYHKDGSEYWNNLLISSAKNNEGDITHFIVIQNDITEKKQIEEKLKRSASVFTHAHEGILITDASGIIIEINDAFIRMTGYTSVDLLGSNPRILQSGRESSEFYIEMWRALLAQGYWRGEIWNRRKNGEVYPVMLTINAVKNTAGLVQHYVSLSSDISSMKAYQGQLEHIAHYDVLTNLPNRVLLADLLSKAMRQSQRCGRSLAVAFMDLDGFKEVNDNRGHNVGDELLVSVSQRMKLALRAGDTLARIGGDEFIALMVNLEKPGDSLPIIKRLLKAAAEPVTIDNDVMQVSTSIGVTIYPQDGANADQLMRHADQAMYIAKRAGKNRYRLFDTEQDNASKTQQKSIENICSAFEQREFVLHYQPKVNMHTKEVIGVEALIRWQHPLRGLVPPLEFLPIIEGHAVSVELGEWVINAALHQISQWQQIGVDLSISVNISGFQLQQNDFTTRLAASLLAHSEVPAHYLELEILETSALHDISKVSATINACHELGVRFALDDFGTGYSSLTHLKYLPAHMIKIDQTFVRDMLESADDYAIVEGVIGLAKAFRRNVIAEGVETKAHSVVLLQLGCELAQGNGIARPMCAFDIPKWLSSWNIDYA